METMDLSTLTASQLQEELQRREATAKQERITKRKSYETDKDNYTAHTASKFQQLNAEMKELKNYTIIEANKLYNRMYEMNDKEPKETKSFSLKNSEDTVKVTVDRQERFEFTEEAMVHINAIKDLFKNKYANRNKRMYGYLDELLIKGKSGDYDPKLLVKIRRKATALEDEDMLSLITNLTDCQRVTGTASYCRLYIREEGKWKDVTLQFSAL